MQGLPTARPHSYFPDLADSLRMDQGLSLQQARRLHEPVGLSGGTEDFDFNPTDMYVPIDSEIFGSAVYRGLDTGYYLVPCNASTYPGLLVLTSSGTQQEWVGCNGSLWINVTSGECRSSMVSEDAVTVPLNVYTGLGNCSGVFGSSPPISDGRLTFVGGTRSTCQQQLYFWTALSEG